LFVLFVNREVPAEFRLVILADLPVLTQPVPPRRPGIAERHPDNHKDENKHNNPVRSPESDELPVLLGHGGFLPDFVLAGFTQMIRSPLHPSQKRPTDHQPDDAQNDARQEASTITPCEICPLITRDHFPLREFLPATPLPPGCHSAEEQQHHGK
jgi:hypothetical protein